MQPAEDDEARIAAVRATQMLDPSGSAHSITLAQAGPARPFPGKVHIVGAGMAGLLAGVILGEMVEAIYESQLHLPNNHTALLRFRTQAVADAVGVEFRPVTAYKAIEPWRNELADALAYSRKVTGFVTGRSILSAGGMGQPATRYIAPDNFIQSMAEACRAPIRFGHEYPKWALRCGGPVISTVPMPVLMDLLDYPRRKEIEFKSRSGWNLVAELELCDAYCSLYVPDPEFPAARISLTGSRLIAECYGKEPKPHLVEDCLAKLGLCVPHHQPFVVPQRYAKILPIDEGERRRFIMWASETYGVFSLGRFATWRPNLLLDDVVHDVKVIRRLITNAGASYPHKLKG